MFSFLPGSHLFQFISLLPRTLNGPLAQTGADARRCLAPGFESCGILFFLRTSTSCERADRVRPETRNAVDDLERARDVRELIKKRNVAFKRAADVLGWEEEGGGALVLALACDCVCVRLFMPTFFKF